MKNLRKKFISIMIFGAMIMTMLPATGAVFSIEETRDIPNYSSAVEPQSLTSDSERPQAQDVSPKPKICYETKNFFNSALTNHTLNLNDSWATLDVKDDMTSVNVVFQLEEQNYSFEAYGTAEMVGDGYIGHYVGYVTPHKDDAVLVPLIPFGETSLFTSVNAVFCDDEMFFTLVIGTISNDHDPIVRAYGVHTDKIKSVANEYANMRKLSCIADYESVDQNIIPTSIDAELVYQNSSDIMKNNLMLGQVSVFHANELRNQGSMTVYAKVNSNYKNANTYARNYFGLTETDISVATPTYVNLQIKSGDPYLHVNNQNYSPKTGNTSYSILVPYYVKYPPAFATITITTSSTTVKTSGTSPYNNQNIELSTSRSIGLSGIDGTYATKTGCPLNVEYKYEGSNVSTAKTANLTATAYLSYDIIVEDSIYGTQHVYTFTTATTSCKTSVKVLP